ncbi:phosphatidylglycerophosphatase A [bacterium]|nr:MAG: phosphatidylglycerophosphatase A [bacterium]
MKVSNQPSEEEPGLPHVSFLTRLIATGLFVGYAPWASGTFGSLLGCAIAFLPAFENPLVALTLIAVGLGAGVISSAKVAAVEGHRLTRSAAVTKAIFQPETHREPDPSIVVIDEIVGMWISLFFLPLNLPTVIAAFVLFRLLDVLKPPPARQLENVPHGWGIMLDDVICGIYANIGTRLFLLLLSIVHV